VPTKKSSGNSAQSHWRQVGLICVKRVAAEAKITPFARAARQMRHAMIAHGTNNKKSHGDENIVNTIQSIG
jgi:hypothetical protein